MDNRKEKAMSAVGRVHNLSLRILTLCGFGALISLGVNILTALIMLIVERKQK